jgi:lipoprotein-anchoring transpeptidase ErfK/SrfK
MMRAMDMGRTARRAAALLLMALVAACSNASPPPASKTAMAEARPVAAPAQQAPAPAFAPAPGAAPTPVLAAASTFAVTTVLEPDQPLQAGEYLWEGEGVAPGATQIVVDIEAQLLYVYRGGVEIGRSFIIYGHDDKPTPTGVFPILEKKKDHISNLYDAEMPFMQRLTWDGVAIHASEVDAAYATHGCVGVPEEFAEILFRETKIGDKVMITNGWVPRDHMA